MLAHAIVILAALGGADDPCKRAGQRYEVARAEVSDAVRAYERCVMASRARETCEAEFGDLDFAQAGYERAVAEYREACRR